MEKYEVELTRSELRVLELYRDRSQERARRTRELEDEEQREQRDAARHVESLVTSRRGSPADNEVYGWRNSNASWDLPHLVILDRSKPSPGGNMGPESKTT